MSTPVSLKGRHAWGMLGLHASHYKTQQRLFVLAVLLPGLTAAMISAGLASLFAAVSYVLLSAPDVAMAEAAIGAGLSTVVFLYAVRKTSAGKE